MTAEAAEKFRGLSRGLLPAVGTERGDSGLERVGEGVPTIRLLRFPLRQLQGCKPSEGLQGLQGLLGLSKDGLWLLGDRLQRKRPGTVNLAAPPACGRIRILDQGCGSLREKGPKARDSGSSAGLEGGARPMTREGSPEAAVPLWAT